MDRKIEKKHQWVKKVIWISFGFVFCGFIIYNIFFGDKSSKLNVQLEKLSVSRVKNDVFQDYIAVIGIVQPIKTIYLDATEGGKVEEILIEEGTMVDTDDVIIRLSNNNLLLEISNNEAQVARAINDLRQMKVNLENQKISTQTSILDLKYSLKQLKRTFTNNRSLYENDHISKEEFELSADQYELAVKKLELLEQKHLQDSIFMEARIAASENSVESMQNNLSLIRNRLEALHIKAPVKGELATLNPEIGEVINYGSRIGTINILDSYKLRVDIDEHYIARVRKGLTGSCDFSGKSYQGKIVKILPEVQNGRFSVDMEFIEEIPDRIRIGQASRIKLELGESKNALLVPRGGFYQSTGGQWVYVVLPDEKMAIKREIRLGRQNPGYYEVLEGLEEGEKVIVSSYDNFGDADKLILKE